MPAPSQLSIATSALNRLVKEEKSYQSEYESQKARIAKLEASQGEDENAEYILRQERKALQETEAMFPQLKHKITEAKDKLEAQLDSNSADQANTPEDINKAKDAMAAALQATADRDTS